MTTSSTDRIHKEVRLRASRERVWRALTDATEFGTWFGVRLGGSFQVGGAVRGRSTHPDYEHLTFDIWVERMEPPRSFAFRWQPQAMDPDVDYSGEPTTLVEFHLEAVDGGTHLTLVESGFDALPEDQRREAFPRNEGGWTLQMDNIRRHVDG